MKLFTMIKLNYVLGKIRKIVNIFTQAKVEKTLHDHMQRINAEVVGFLFTATAQIPDAIEAAAKLDPELTLDVLNTAKVTYDSWKALILKYKGKAIGDVAEEFVNTFKPSWDEYIKNFERAGKVTEATIDEIFDDVDPDKEIEELKAYVKKEL